MLVVVAVDAEVLPVGAVRRVIARIAVLVVDGEQVSVFMCKLPCTFGTDKAVDLQGCLAVVLFVPVPHNLPLTTAHVYAYRLGAAD